MECCSESHIMLRFHPLTTRCALLLVGTTLVTVSICHEAWKPKPNISVSFSLNGSSENTVILNPAQQGKHVLYLICDRSSLQPALREANFPWPQGSYLNWRTTLMIEGEDGVLIRTNVLSLRPSATTGTQLYFRIASLDLKVPERIKIRISPIEESHLLPPVSLIIKPSPLDYERYAFDNLKWYCINIISVLVTLSLAVRWIVQLNRERKRRQS